MATRSRHGCIDCKKAKVKCDEEHPSCGTCKRRGRKCSGYNPVILGKRQRDEAAGRAQSRKLSGQSDQLCGSPSHARNGSFDHGTPDAVFTPQQEVDWALQLTSSGNASLAIAPFSPAADGSSLTPATHILKTVSTLPRGVINPADEPFIEVYFMRHPTELVFGPEFVTEMNSSVLKVFQNNPVAVSDSLCAIGEAYLKDSNLALTTPVANRKARILARLRTMDNLGVSLELLLTIMLGLCAIELVDKKDHQPQASSLPALLGNLAMMLDHHLSRGLELTQLAKYFVRALARQDMMLSLTRCHRPRIQTSYWLDDYARHHADRFMGYISTLMPILADLCALAEDVWSPINGLPLNGSPPEAPFDSQFPDPTDFTARASQIQTDLELWHATVDPTLSFQSSRKFLMHANSFRSAALLYLFRLFNPPGSSLQADQTALKMAYEVMVHMTCSDEDMKMSLWPAFIATCEVHNEVDRMTATQMLGSICRARKTITALRTRSFVVNRVWQARDSGLDWNWMSLARQHPEELLPI